MYTAVALGVLPNRRSSANSAHTVLPEPGGAATSTFASESYNDVNTCV